MVTPVSIYAHGGRSVYEGDTPSRVAAPSNARPYGPGVEYEPEPDLPAACVMPRKDGQPCKGVPGESGVCAAHAEAAFAAAKRRGR